MLNCQDIENMLGKDMFVCDSMRNFFILFVYLAMVGTGCAREPIKLVCPSVSVGDLAISEIRGMQSPDDNLGQWIEIYNLGSSPVELNGLQLIMNKLDGSSEDTLVVRSRQISIEGHDYFVMGQFFNDDLPLYVDYGYLEDFSADLYSNGLYELHACNQLIDRVIVRDLTKEGSFAFDGSLELTADSNDSEDSWCIDDSEVSLDGASGVRPGTPRQENNPCN